MNHLSNIDCTRFYTGCFKHVLYQPFRTTLVNDKMNKSCDLFTINNDFFSSEFPKVNWMNIVHNSL